MKNNKFFLPLLLPFTATTVKASACTDGWSILQSYDLFSVGNVWTSSEVEGKTFIGGDLTSGNSANFGIHLSSTTDVTFEIAGGFTGGNPININKGSLAHNSAVNSFLQNPAVGWNVDGRMVNINDGNSGAGASADAGIGTKAATLKASLEDLSMFLKNLPDTTSISLPGSNDQPQAVNIQIDSVDAAGVAILTLNGNSLFDNQKVQQIEIKNNVGAELVVINVEGTSISWNNGNMVGSFLTQVSGRSKMIWNFYEATHIDFKSKNMMGNVVAPYAHVKTQANIDGATAVGSFESMSEVHFPLLSVPCPYPDTAVGGGGGDPHFQRWGQERTTFHGECDLVMVHSDQFHDGAGFDLHVRTTMQDYFSFIETAAFRVGADIVQFYADAVFLNGFKLEPTTDLPLHFGGAFRYTVRDVTIEQGKDKKFYQYYQVDLHNDSKILFKFYKHFLTIDISGHANDFSDSVGLLGEYRSGAMFDRDGLEMYDFTEFGFEWQVQPSDPAIFLDQREPQLPFESCRLPTGARPARRTLRTNQELVKQAEHACSHLSSSDAELCVDDVLMTNDIGIAFNW
eukprot:scaffold538_cov166-Amphora_coffeaeformis.AAC.3